MKYRIEEEVVSAGGFTLYRLLEEHKQNVRESLIIHADADYTPVMYAAVNKPSVASSASANQPFSSAQSGLPNILLFAQSGQTPESTSLLRLVTQGRAVAKADAKSLGTQTNNCNLTPSSAGSERFAGIPMTAGLAIKAFLVEAAVLRNALDGSSRQGNMKNAFPGKTLTEIPDILVVRNSTTLRAILGHPKCRHYKNVLCSFSRLRGGEVAPEPVLIRHGLVENASEQGTIERNVLHYLREMGESIPLDGTPPLTKPNKPLPPIPGARPPVPAPTFPAQARARTPSPPRPTKALPPIPGARPVPAPRFGAQPPVPAPRFGAHPPGPPVPSRPGHTFPTLPMKAGKGPAKHQWRDSAWDNGSDSD